MHALLHVLHIGSAYATPTLVFVLHYKNGARHGGRWTELLYDHRGRGVFPEIPLIDLFAFAIYSVTDALS
jgi:hypothetical protein